MSRLEQLIRYMSNVFHLPRLVKGVTSTRDGSRTRIATSAVLLAWLLRFSIRIRSREELGRLLDRPGVRKLFGSHVSSDTLGRVRLTPIGSGNPCSCLWCGRSGTTRLGRMGVSMDRYSSQSTAASRSALRNNRVLGAVPAYWRSRLAVSIRTSPSTTTELFVLISSVPAPGFTWTSSR